MCLLLWKDIFYISEPETAYAEGPSRFISRFRGRRNRNRKRFEGVIERNNSLLTESELDARIATEGVITNDNASLLETQTDDATLTTLLTPTEKDLDPSVDSSAITASPCCMQAPEESSICIVERVEAAPYSIPVGRERVCVPCSGRFFTLSGIIRSGTRKLSSRGHPRNPARRDGRIRN